MITRKSFPGVFAIVATFYANAVSGQNLVLEEVIVTAQKRSQNLQDVPIAVSAVSGDKINAVGIVNLQEVTLYTPNVNVNSGASQPNLFIRGVGSGTNTGFEQSAGLFIDGVYSGRGQLAGVPLTMDLQRIEILKGPQGILFGKNTIAGAINIISAPPSRERLSSIDALYEPSHGEELLTVVINGPLSERLAGRLAVRRMAIDGWWTNEFDGGEGPEQENWYARGALRWEFDDIDVTAKIEYGDFDRQNAPQIVYQSDQPVNFLGDQVFPVISDGDRGWVDQGSSDQTETSVFALTANWDLNFATLTSLTAYSAYDTFREQDSDYSATAALNRELDEEYEQFSHEFRLASPGGETIDWIAGAYYQTSKLDVSRLNLGLDFALLGPLSVPPLVGTQPGRPNLFNQDSDSWALFAQATWKINDRLRSSLGIRYNEEEKKLLKSSFAEGLGARAAVNGPAAQIIVLANPVNGGLISDVRSHQFPPIHRKEDKITWSGNLQWDFGHDAMLYASISTGFKGGGFDESYSGDDGFIRTGNLFTGEPDGGVIITDTTADTLAYDEETVFAYELGLKTSLAKGAATLNLALFRSENEDLQVSALIGDVFTVGNAGKSISQGIELDGRWRLTERLTISSAVAYLDATYDEFLGATCTLPQSADPVNNPGCLREDGSNISAGESGGQNLEGETLLFAPKWSANFSMEFVQPLRRNLALRASVDINYRDEFYSALDLDPNTVHDSSTKLNARIGIGNPDRSWSIAVIGKNLTDEKTMVWRNDVATTNSNSYFGVPERPRSIGLQARYAFQ
ncbi:MAG: TonB-dependent receptor [Pseudomonadota bacterium]